MWKILMVNGFKKTINKILRIFGCKITKINKFTDPVAPFDVLCVVVEMMLHKGGNIYYANFGLQDQVKSFSLDYVIRKFQLTGIDIFNYLDHEMGENLIKGLPVKAVTLLNIGLADKNYKLIKEAFEAGICPLIINLERIGMTPEQTRITKLYLLDQGYRFIDNGGDSVFLKLQSE